MRRIPSEIEPHRLAVVGFGPTGLALLTAILDRWVETPRALEIHLFDPACDLGTGVAFGRQAAANRMNTTVDTTAISAARPDDFLEWLRENGTPAEPRAFVPRARFGDYLRARRDDALLRAEALGLPVRVYRTAVWEMDVDGDRAVVRFGAETLAADSAVLCTGNVKLTAFPALAGHPGFFPSPYELDRPLDTVAANAKVLVVGSKLSAIDAVVQLLANGHRGPVVLASRSGLLPAINKDVDLRHRGPVPALDRIETTAGFAEAVRAGFALAYAAEVGAPLPVMERTLDDPDAEFRRDYCEAVRTPRAWERLMLPLVDAVERAWPRLSSEERLGFLRRFGVPFYRYASSFPLVNARTLSRAMRRRQVSLRGKLADVTATATGFTARFADGRTVTADVVVDASGYGNGTRGDESELFRAIVEKKLFATNGSGGFAIEPATYRLLDGDGKPHVGCYALGYPIRASVPFANWFNRIVAAAAVVADHVLARGGSRAA